MPYSESLRFDLAMAKAFAKLAPNPRPGDSPGGCLSPTMEWWNMSERSRPTEVELQILRIIWDLGPSPVREIHARLEAEKGTNYSTTVKMLSVMLHKGLVTRTEGQRPHIYRATVSRAAAGQQMVRDLIDKVYEGSAASLVLQALSSSRPSSEEIEEVRQFLDDMEDRQ